MRKLTTETAALALGIDRKAFDNLLARQARGFLVAGRRGKSRRIDVAVLERIAVALILSRDIGVSVAKGLDFAEAILREPGGGEIRSDFSYGGSLPRGFL